MEGVMKKKLPIGLDDFEKLRQNDFYYVDKTGFIRELVRNWSEVNLFTRPRRFGKSLNMSMLKYFFEPGTDTEIFDGLDIAEETELCEKYMGKFPVISVSLKGIDGNSYEDAFGMAVRTVTAEAGNFQYLMDSVRLTEQDKDMFLELMKNDMTEPTFCDSLKTLSRLLRKHYNQKVILLIDEYDVPLQKAFDQGYYAPMLKLIRNFLGQALKTNPSLQFAVLTGCLRISKGVYLYAMRQ